MRSLIAYFLKIASVLVAFATLLSYLSPYVNPGRFPWIAFFGTAYPWLLLLNVFLLFLWWWGRNRFAFYHLGIILLGWNALSGFWGIHWAKDPIPEDSMLVVTHNLGNILGKKKRTADNYQQAADEYAAYLRQQGVPDVICTQETSAYFYRRLAENLGYAHTFNLKKGTVILSKYPMEAGGDIPLGKTANSALWADLNVAGRVLRVYNVHLQSNRVTDQTEKVLEDPDAIDHGSFNEVGGILWKVGEATSIRADQSEKVREHIGACKHPVLVCGDLNDTPNSYVYRIISNDMHDAFREKGLGSGATFAGVLPFLRIDYVLSSQDLQPFRCKTLTKRFSDHYGVMATVGWPNK
jgi:endonuclease/exonuclease/phosphatase family metal-dependent hydrolase